MHLFSHINPEESPLGSPGAGSPFPASADMQLCLSLRGRSQRRAGCAARQREVLSPNPGADGQALCMVGRQRAAQGGRVLTQTACAAKSQH